MFNCEDNFHFGMTLYKELMKVKEHYVVVKHYF